MPTPIDFAIRSYAHFGWLCALDEAWLLAHDFGFSFYEEELAVLRQHQANRAVWILALEDGQAS